MSPTHGVEEGRALVINRTTPARSNQGTGLLRATSTTPRRDPHRPGSHPPRRPVPPTAQSSALVLTNSESPQMKPGLCAGLPVVWRPEALGTSWHHGVRLRRRRAVVQTRRSFTGSCLAHVAVTSSVCAAQQAGALSSHRGVDIPTPKGGREREHPVSLSSPPFHQQ